MPQPEARRAEERDWKGREGGVLEMGCFTPHQLWGLGSTVSSQGVRSEASATCRFRTFYRLTAPGVSFVKYLYARNCNVCTQVKFLWSPRHRKPSQPKFCGGPDPHGIGAYNL